MNELLTDMKKYTDECKEQIQVLDFEQNKACGLDITNSFSLPQFSVDLVKNNSKISKEMMREF